LPDDSHRDAPLNPTASSLYNLIFRSERGELEGEQTSAWNGLLRRVPIALYARSRAGCRVRSPRRGKKTVYTKAIKLRQVGYNSPSDTVTVELAKPHKGAVEVTVDGAIEALDGATTTIHSLTFIKSTR
jgi:hypothetical protein